MKAICIDRCVVLSFKFELNESILKQLIEHLFHTFLLLFHFQSKYGCPISSKNHKIVLYFEYYTVIQRLKDYLKFCTTTKLSLDQQVWGM